MSFKARRALAGVRIIDLSQVFAGPYATKLLADMGAEVIRVECAARSGRGGSLPRMRPGGDFGASFPDGDTGEHSYNRFAYYNEVNRNKYAITIDLSKSHGASTFKRLVSISDVVVENFSPRVMRNFGLDYAALRETNPQIIMISISGYGQDGPYRDHVSYGEGIEAMSGMSKLTAYDEDTPLKPGIAYADATAGLHAAFAIMAALRYRHIKGVGQYIDLSMRETLTPLFGEAIMDYAMNRRIPEPMGNRHAQMAPHGCYRTKGDDRWIVIAVSCDEEWRTLCQVMDNQQWSRDERFVDLAGRLAHQDELDRMIEKWTIGYDHIELANILQSHGIKAGAVLDAADLVNDPHLKERRFFEEIEHPEAGKHIMPGISWKMSRTPGRIESPAPCFSEHNQYVFGKLLGMSDEEIEKLAQEGVTAEAPLPYTET
ncbi:MAG: CoA transferase [Dehalococcoidia bacterium]|jgi:crotonobetainyl-CoA:carnitine CoA-transferase CaiB-like acyl-CoA transferase